MYQPHTEKQQKYFKEVIRLHYEEGYGEHQIARIIPIGHTTAARWIAIYSYGLAMAFCGFFSVGSEMEYTR